MSSNTNANNVTTLPSTPKPQTSKEVIAANVQLLIEQLEAGHSEGLTAYLTAMGRFHTYSFGNILEIARQMTTCSGWYFLPCPISSPCQVLSYPRAHFTPVTPPAAGCFCFSLTNHCPLNCAG